MLAILLNAARLRREKKARFQKRLSSIVCCRTCLTTENLHPIFYRKGGVGHTRSEDLRLVTGLEDAQIIPQIRADSILLTTIFFVSHDKKISTHLCLHREALAHSCMLRWLCLTAHMRAESMLKIKLNDGLPQQICSKCEESVFEALRFKRTAGKSNETFLRMGFRRVVTRPAVKVSRKNIQAKTTADPLKNVDNTQSDNVLFDTYEDAFQENGFEKEVEPRRYSKALKARDVAPFKCSECNKQYRMKSAYTAHMRSHCNYCVCELCGKKCRNNNLLLLHKRGRHGVERIHKCSYCQYSASNREGLVIHERRHTGEKPYVCDHCGASFHRRSNLVQHIAIHLPDKNFQCDICSKRVKSRKFLQIHKHNAHTGRRYAYLCPLCARRFEKPNKVRAHMRSAHGVQAGDIKRVECDQCQKRFHSKKFLQGHKFKMHQGRRYSYVCHVCKAQFTSTDATRRHLTRVHSVPREAQGTLCRIPNPQLKSRIALAVEAT